MCSFGRTTTSGRHVLALGSRRCLCHQLAALELHLRACCGPSWNLDAVVPWQHARGAARAAAAPQVLLTNHALLALWGSQALALVVDIDEYLATPQPATALQVGTRRSRSSSPSRAPPAGPERGAVPAAAFASPSRFSQPGLAAMRHKRKQRPRPVLGLARRVLGAGLRRVRRPGRGRQHPRGAAGPALERSAAAAAAADAAAQACGAAAAEAAAAAAAAAGGAGGRRRRGPVVLLLLLLI